MSSVIGSEDLKFIEEQTKKYADQIRHVPAMNRVSMISAFRQGLLTAMSHLCDQALLQRAQRELKNKFLTQE